MKKLRLKLAIVAIALTAGMGVQQVVNASDGARPYCHVLCSIVPGTTCRADGECDWDL